MRDNARWRDSTEGGSPVLVLLANGIPITLLMDLADPAGPQSADLLAHERGCSTCNAAGAH